MDVLALGRGCVRVHDRPDQWMREAETASVERENSSFDHLRESVARLGAVECGVDERGARIRGRGDDEQRVAHALGQESDPVRQQFAEVVRNGQRLARSMGLPAAKQSRGKLECEEWVSAGRPLQLGQGRAQERGAESITQQTVERVARQRAERDLVYGERPEQRRRLAGLVAAESDDHADGLVGESSERELEDAGGRSVEPLEVVDREHERVPARERSNRCEEGERDRVLIGRVGALARRSACSIATRCGSGSSSSTSPMTSSRMSARAE